MKEQHLQVKKNGSIVSTLVAKINELSRKNPTLAILENDIIQQVMQHDRLKKPVFDVSKLYGANFKGETEEAMKLTMGTIFL